MTQELFMTFAFFVLIIYLAFLSMKKFSLKISIQLPRLSSSNKYFIEELLYFLIKDEDTRKRLLITIGIIIAIRICYIIPMPGIDAVNLSKFWWNLSKASVGNVALGYFPIMNRMSIFCLGIMPFLSACVLIQLSSIFIPLVRRALFGEEKGRNQIAKYTYILTIIISLIQAYFISIWLENPSRFGGMSIVTMHGLPLRIVSMVSLTGAVLLLLFLANIINKYGIGNGIAIIVISGILIEMIIGVYQMYLLSNSAQLTIFGILIIIAIFIGFLWLAFFFTNKDHKIGLKNIATQKEFTIPLKVSWLGDLPVGFAQTVYLLPATIASFIASSTIQNFASQYIRNIWISFLITGVLIVIFTYLYMLVVFNSKKVQNLTQRYNFECVSSEEKNIVDYLDANASKILLITAAFLIVSSSAPSIIATILKIPHIVSSLFVGMNILILAGVFSDILKQLEFFYDKSKMSDKNLKIAYVAFDEIEAGIKSEHLKNNGIVSLVEPLRFTWGMPIRTAVDQYRIYAPVDKIEEAKRLCGGAS